MPDQSIDERVAARLAMVPQQAAIYREEWERSPQASVARTAIVVKLEDHISETTRKLRTCQPDELKGLQGSLLALELAISTVSNRIVG